MPKPDVKVQLSSFKGGSLISQTAEYALRAIVYLATNPNLPVTNKEIAEAARVPAGYLSKVLQSLGRAGLVNSYRGLGGGFILTRDPADITILHIIQAVEPIQRIHSCPLGLAAHGVNLCPLHRRLDDAMANVEKAFAQSTVAELLAEETTSKPLCPYPNQKPPKKK